MIQPIRAETPSMLSSVIQSVKEAMTPKIMATESVSMGMQNPPVSESPSGLGAKKLSFCKLDDPECEACQWEKQNTEDRIQETEFEK